MTRIPRGNLPIQYNRSDILGDIDVSFNLDLTKNEGAFRTTRMKLNIDTTDNANLDNVVGAFVNYSNDFYAISSDVYKGDSFPSDTFTEDVSSGNPNLSFATCDGAVFNNALYVTDIATPGGTLTIKKLSGTTWSTADSQGSVDIGVALLKEFDNKLYVTAEGNKVWHLTSGDTLNTTGTATLELPLPDGWVITMLETGSNKLWIGCLNTNGVGGIVYEWDGLTENTTARSYNLENGVMAGIVKDNTPYIMDSQGVLSQFNGASFSEIARLPVEGFPLVDNEQELNTRWIHPRGMEIMENNIILGITNDRKGATSTSDKLPSGIWEYNTSIGLYHKYSVSSSRVGSTDITDYGQINTFGGASALTYYRKAGSETDNGTILWGVTTMDENTGIYTNDTLDTTQDWGFFITSKIFSDRIAAKWSSIYSVYKKLINSTDKIVIKYKTQDDTPIEAVIAWVDTNTFTSTTDISAYTEGDEVQVIYGKGSGKSAHISSITESGGTYTVNLDDTFTGVSGAAGIRLEKWIKASEISGDNAETQWNQMTLPTENVSPWIKFKVCMQFTGENELYKLETISKSEINK